MLSWESIRHDILWGVTVFPTLSYRVAAPILGFMLPGGVAQRQGVRHFPAGAAIGLGQETREAAGGREPNTRRVERVSNLDWVARAGDVFLFRCKGLLSRLQRWFSRSEWDHVGMVRWIDEWMGAQGIVIY